MGISEQLLKFSEMKNDDITKVLSDLIPRLRGDEVLDMGETKDEEEPQEEDEE